VRSNSSQCVKTDRPCTIFSDLLRVGTVLRHCAPPKDGRKEGGRRRDTRQWVKKTRIRNAHLVITHVLDSCAKLLTVLYISSTQGRDKTISLI